MSLLAGRCCTNVFCHIRLKMLKDTERRNIGIHNLNLGLKGKDGLHMLKTAQRKKTVAHTTNQMYLKVEQKHDTIFISFQNLFKLFLSASNDDPLAE